MISEDNQFNSYNTYIIIEKLIKLKLHITKEYSKENYQALEDDFDDIEQRLNFKEYFNFGRILLNFFSNIIEVNVDYDIEGEDNLRKVRSPEESALFFKAKTKRYNHIKKKHPRFFADKGLDFFLKNYLNWKMYHWKSVLYRSSQIKKSICRICDDELYLNEFVLHLCCCKNKSKLKTKLNDIKIELSRTTNRLVDNFSNSQNSNEQNLFTGQTKFLDMFIDQVKSSLPSTVSYLFKFNLADGDK